MPAQDLDAQLRDLLAAACRRAGVPAAGAGLVWLHSNALFALPGPGLLVRIATNPDALTGVTAAVRTTRWLAARGFPCTVPADLPDQPLVEQGRVVSFWHYLPAIAEAAPTVTELAGLLHWLHEQPLPPDPPDRLVDPLRSVAAAAKQPPEALPDQHRRWLAERISELPHRHRNRPPAAHPPNRPDHRPLDSTQTPLTQPAAGPGRNRRPAPPRCPDPPATGAGTTQRRRAGAAA